MTFKEFWATQTEDERELLASACYMFALTHEAAFWKDSAERLSALDRAYAEQLTKMNSAVTHYRALWLGFVELCRAPDARGLATHDERYRAFCRLEHIFLVGQRLGFFSLPHGYENFRALHSRFMTMARELRERMSAEIAAKAAARAAAREAKSAASSAAKGGQA